MANYILGVETPSNYKLYKEGATLPSENFTKIADITGLKAGLITGESVTSIDLPSNGNVGIKVSEATGKYTVTVGNAVIETTQPNVTFTPTTNDTVILALDSGVGKSVVSYSAAVSVVSEKGVITITPSSTTGWYISGTEIKYDNGNSQTATTTTISGDLKATIGEDDYTLNTTDKTITLKTSAFDMDNLADKATVQADNTGFKLRLGTGFTEATATPVADTDFTWDVTATKVTVGTEEIDSKTAVLSKKVTPGWQTTTTDQKYTYSKPGTLTYATITGLAASVTENDMPTVAKDAAVTDGSTAYPINLDVAELPTVEGAVVTLQNGGTVNVDGTEKAPNFTLTTTAAATAVAIEDSYETKVEVKNGQTTATATVSQMMSEYWEPGTDSDADKKLTYHASKANATPLATVTGLASTAKGGDNLASGETANVIFDTDSAKTITLKAGALDPSSTTVSLISEAYKLELAGDVTEYDADNHGNPTPLVNGITATIKVTPNPGWVLGVKNDETKAQTVTYSAPAAITVATINGVASGVDPENIVINGNTITLNKAVLPDDATANASVTLEENTEEANIYQATYDFKLVLDSSADKGVTKYGSGTKTPTLVVNEANTQADPAEDGDKVARIQVVNTAGWELADTGLTVTKKAQETVDWLKVTGLAAAAKYTNDDANDNTVTFNKDTKTITFKEDALPDGNVTLTRVEKTTDTTGYKLALDNVTEPGSKYDDSNLEVGTPIDGVATITGTLVKGWSKTNDATITYTPEQTDLVLATISGLGEDATADDIIQGSTLDKPSTTEKNVFYLTKDALENDDPANNSNVTLTNNTIKTKADDGTTVIGTCAVDFKLSLKKEVEDDGNTEYVETDKLGYEKIHAWSLNNAKTNAFYKEGTEQGWKIADDTHITYDAKILPEDGDTLLTVTGLKGGDNFDIDMIENPEESSADKISAVFTDVDGTEVPVLWINEIYVEGKDAVKDDEGNVTQAAVTEVIGKVMVNRLVLDDSANGKAAVLTVADGFGKYQFDLYSETDTGDETKYVPSKEIKKYIWTLDDEGESVSDTTTSASYKEVTAEYWKLSDDGKTATYNAQTNGEILARITGIAGGLAVASESENPDFTAHANAAAGDDYVIKDSFISSYDNSNDTLIAVTTEYIKDTDGTTDGDQTQLGVITISDGALNEANVTFVSDVDKGQYRFALETNSSLNYADPLWAVDGTTATYKQEVETEGYALTGKEKEEDTTGTAIIYNNNTPLVLATIKGLKDLAGYADDNGDLADTDGDEAIEVDETGDSPVFKLNGNVLGSTKVELTNGAGQSYKLAIGEGALDADTTDEELQARKSNGVDVWRLTKNNKGEVTAAVYKTVKPSYYTLASDSLSIINTPETNGTTKVTITGLANNILVKEKAPDADDFTSKLGYEAAGEFEKGVSLSEPDTETGVTTITVLSAEMLDGTKIASIPSSAKYVFEVDTDAITPVAVDDSSVDWEVNAGTAILTGDISSGWGLDTAGKTITHYEKAEGRVIATIRGLKSTLGNDDLRGVGLPNEDGGSFVLNKTLLDKDATLTNGTNLDGRKFTYGLELASAEATAATAAIEGVPRWYLKDDTTLNYSKIHDAHYEDNAVNNSVDATTIKYVAESIDATPLASITNVANGSTFITNVTGEGVTADKYNAGTGTLVTGISVNSTNIEVIDKAAVFEDPNKALTLTNNDSSFKFSPTTSVFATPTSGSENFKVNGTTAILYSGKSAGYSTNNTKIAYVEPTYDKIVTKIDGLKSGLVAGSVGAGVVNKNAVGTVDDNGTFTEAITYDTGTYKYTVKKGALTNTDVSITEGKGTLAIGSDVKGDSNNLAEHYIWKVSGTTATYNKGNKAGWAVASGDDAGKKIIYSDAAYDTVVSTVTGLASGLKVDPKNDQQILDKNNKVAINLYNDDAEIQLHSPALTTKNVLLKRAMSEGDTPAPVSQKAASFRLFRDKDTSSGTTTEKEGYVAGKNISGKFDADKVAGNKATYTVTTVAGHDIASTASEGYDGEVIYTKAGKVTTTITGLKNDTNTSAISLADPNGDDADPTTGTFTVAKASLADESNVKLTNGNGNSFKLKLDGVNVDSNSAPVWNFKNGTAIFTQTYTKGDYMTKTADTEFTYLKANNTETLFTITGLDKTQFKESPEAGIAAGTVETDYGIKLVTDKVITPASTDPTTGELISAAVTANVVQLNPAKVKLAAANVVIKNGTQKYEFDLSANGAADELAVKDYSAKDNQFQWSYNKGTATLDAGTSQGWVYKSDTDHNILTYKKAVPKVVATIKGLNATNLVLGTDADGNNQIYHFTETTDNNGNTTRNIESSTLAITYTSPDGSDPGTIVLTTGALVEGKALKDKVKVTLTTSNGSNYVLDSTTNDIDVPEDGDKEWSVDTKGIASYQYTTGDGWTLDSSTQKTLTYSAEKTTVLAKIGGLTKDTDTTLGISTYEKVTDPKTGKVTYQAATKDTLGYIDVTTSKTADGNHDKYTFTFKTDSNGINKALPTNNVTLTTVDKTTGNEYEIVADEDLAPHDYGKKWTVDGKSGKATYTAGMTAGYTNVTTGNKAGTTITYNKEKVNTTLATITGLVKDAAVLTDTAFNNVVEVNDEDKKINITSAQSIFASGDKATTVTLSSKEGYTFGTVAGNNIETPATTVTVKSGTVNVVTTASAGKFTVSADNMKVVYNKKATDTILATVKGLNKDLTESNLKTGIDSSLSSVTSGVTYATNTGTITLSKDALANSKVTFTLGKGVEEDAYKLKLNPDQVNKANGIMTNTGSYREITGWVENNGTATYKTYDLAYYSPDGKGGFNYTKENKGVTHATITGLKAGADVSGFKNAGAITLGSDQLITLDKNNKASGKNVTLKNTEGYNFTLALDTTTVKRVTESGLDSNSYAWDKGKLTVTQKAGYTLASDTSITYLAKDKEKQLVATLSGIDTTKTISFNKSTGAIMLTADNLAKKNVTLTTTGLDGINYTLNYSGAKSPAVSASSKQADPWSLKGTTATFTGYVKEDTYTVAASGKSITYTKANGTDESPKALTTIKGVTAAPTGSTTPTIASGSATLSSGLLAVSYGGNNITGSKDADTITLTNGGSVTVNAGKGDDEINLGSAAATIVYANNDGFDVINGFSDNDKIKISGVAITADNVTRTASSTFIEVGKGSIELHGYSNGTVAITDKSGTETKYNPSTSSDVLLADNNYSMDAAALSDIVEPFHASYTPYDFESGLDLVKKDSFAPAFTYTGDNDKK